MIEINYNMSGKEYVDILERTEFKLQIDNFDSRFYNIFKSELLSDKLSGYHKEDTGFGTIYHLAPMTYAMEYYNEEGLLENMNLLKSMIENKDKLDLGKGYHLPNKILGYITYGDGKYYLALNYDKIFPVDTTETTYKGHIISVKDYLNGLEKDKLEDFYKVIDDVKLSELITKIKSDKVLEVKL